MKRSMELVCFWHNLLLMMTADTVKSKTLSLKITLSSAHGNARCWLFLAPKKRQGYFRYVHPWKYLTEVSLNPMSNPRVHSSVISTGQAEFNIFLSWKFYVLKDITKQWLLLFPLPSLKSSILHTLFPCGEEVNPRLIPLIPGVGQSQKNDFLKENFNEQQVEKDMLLGEQKCSSFCPVVRACWMFGLVFFFQQLIQKTAVPTSLLRSFALPQLCCLAAIHRR